MFAERLIVERVDIPIEGITLLSVEESQKLSKDILHCESDDWWLRSPGNSDDKAAVVRGLDDCVDQDGCSVDDEYGVRPALRVHPFHSNPYGVRIGDTIRLFGYKWTVISDTLLLCNDLVDDIPFRKNGKAEDTNDYEKSDIKKWLENWYKEQSKWQVERESGLLGMETII